MDNEQNNPKDQARNLFFETGLTQAQIAALVGVSQKTISVWINEGRWKYLKETAQHMPAILIEQMTNEISEIHACIAARDPGQRFATLQEAEIRRKTLMSIKYFQTRQMTNAHIEVLGNFINYIKRIDTNDARKIVELADQYLIGEKKINATPGYQPYSLFGDVEIPLPFGFSPRQNELPKGNVDNAADLDKAA